MIYINTIANRKGVALIVVLLLILAVTAVALVALKISQIDDRASMAFLYSRQAQQVAHGVGLQMESYVSENAQKVFNEKSGIIRQNEITPFSGMSTIAIGNNLSSRLQGDLSREILQLGTVGDLSLINKPVAGFSNGEAYCSFVAKANSYAVIGKILQIHETEANELGVKKRYYVLPELNAQIISYKREIGALNVEPLNCYTNMGE